MNHEELRVTFDARNKLTRHYNSVIDYISHWLDQETYATLNSTDYETDVPKGGGGGTKRAPRSGGGGGGHTTTTPIPTSTTTPTSTSHKMNTTTSTATTTTTTTTLPSSGGHDVDMLTICCELKKGLFELCSNGGSSMTTTIQVKMFGGSTEYYGFINDQLQPEKFHSLTTSSTRPIILPNVCIMKAHGIIPILTKDQFGIAVLILDYVSLLRASTIQKNYKAEEILQSAALKIYYKNHLTNKPILNFKSQKYQNHKQNLLHLKNKYDIREILSKAAIQKNWKPHKSIVLLITGS